MSIDTLVGKGLTAVYTHQSVPARTTLLKTGSTSSVSAYEVSHPRTSVSFFQSVSWSGSRGGKLRSFPALCLGAARASVDCLSSRRHRFRIARKPCSSGTWGWLCGWGVQCGQPQTVRDREGVSSRIGRLGLVCRDEATTGRHRKREFRKRSQPGCQWDGLERLRRQLREETPPRCGGQAAWRLTAGGAPPAGLLR